MQVCLQLPSPFASASMRAGTLFPVLSWRSQSMTRMVTSYLLPRDDSTAV